MNESIIKKPHVTVVASYFYPKVGGLETIAYTTAKMLQESGNYTVSIISSNYDGKGYRKDMIDGMTVHRLPIAFRLSNTPINFAWSKMITKIFDEEKPSLVHTHSPVPFMADVAAAVAHKKHIPLVVTYHSGSMRKGNFILDLIIGVYELYFLKKLLQRADHIVAVARNFIPVVFPQFINKVSFIPTGVDLERFKKTAVPNNERVAFVGRVELSSMWKGIEYLIKAMAIVIKKRPSATLEIVGGGDALGLYTQQAKDLNIQDNFITPGPQYGAELVKAFERMNVMVLPSTSDSEAFSVSLVEAMASGRPIIGTNIGGTPQVIDNGVTGLIVEPKNPQALAEAIEKIISDHAFAQALGDAGSLKAQGFSWEIQTGKYIEIYNSLIK
ncbi:MAG TPA: glycosyltransferase family 4 protein [Candidatus Paceibacterota bacterium]|jgi:glycosyltransferase involved in cell wall biosynthesis|nr:glycosyltransferase family 4 protein [Candidatus Paceibacterota bacterium]